MKKFFISLCVTSLLSLSAIASSVEIGVVDVVAPDNVNPMYTVYGTDGLIYEIDPSDRVLVESTEAAAKDNSLVVFTLSSEFEAEDILAARNLIVGIKLTTQKSDIQTASKLSSNRKSVNFNNSDLLNDYITNFATTNEANRVFLKQRRDTRKRSQCYNRAHVWSWEMRANWYNGRKVQPGKLWIFFTKKYIRAYRYKWWFHITPYVRVNGEDMAMDRSYMAGPTSIRGWTDFFVTSREECEEVTKYSVHHNNQFTRHCYIMKTSVHYWQPFQIENLETGSAPRTQWMSGELKTAYRNGIGRRASRRIPQL